MSEKQLNLSQLKIDRLSWKDVLTDNLSEQDKKIYNSRKHAVDMYIDGKKIFEIQNVTGIHRTKVALLVEKCLNSDDSTGEYYGYTALLPYKRMRNYTRKKESLGNPNSLNGSFNKLLIEYPSLYTFINNNLFGKREDTLEKNVSPTILHRKFLNECKKHGIQEYEYPFNTRSKCSITFRNYVKTLLNTNEKYAIQRESKNAIQKFNSTGKGKKFSQNSLAPFNTVQLDGHKIDLLYTYEVENKNGELLRNTATRCWLIAVVDVATRVILGYSITPHENYNQTDVLAAIQNSIQPRVKHIFTIPGFEYPSNGGYYSIAFPHISWALFDNIMLDNAKAHLATDVVSKLTEKLKCSVNFGSVATPETRGIVERMFRTLEENGYHRIVSTTGSNIFDNKRKYAEQDALKYKVKIEDIEEMTEYFIALYNNSPHKALDNETPLQCMKRRIDEAGMLPCIAEREEKKVIENLTNIVITRTIRGSFKGGKRPYIYYLGVEYRSDILSYSMDMIGEKLQIEINPKDISFVKSYFMDGSELGILNATGEWGLKPHSIKTRKEVMKYAKDNSDKNTPFIAHISDYEEELRNRSSKSRRAGTKAAIIKKEQQNASMMNNVLIQKATMKEMNEKIDKTTSSFDNTLISMNTKKEQSYSSDIEELLLSMSIEEAFEKGLL